MPEGCVKQNITLPANHRSSLGIKPVKLIWTQLEAMIFWKNTLNSEAADGSENSVPVQTYFLRL